MLSRPHRLTRRRDFARVNAVGKNVYASHLRLRWVKVGADKSRFAVVVSTKVSKRATQRNKLKRRLREIVREHKPNIKPGIDIVISALPAALSCSYQELNQEVQVLLRKAALLV